MTPKEAAFRLREWHEAFTHFGKGNEWTVHEFLEAADLIESLAADLDTLREFTKELSAWNEELRNEKTTFALRVKQLEAERDAAVADLKSYRCCHGCKHLDVGFNEPCLHCDFENNCFEWRGVQKEE